MIDRRHRLPVVQQCRVLGVARSSAYYVSQPVSAADLALMRLIDELHLQYPNLGNRPPRESVSPSPSFCPIVRRVREQQGAGPIFNADLA